MTIAQTSGFCSYRYDALDRVVETLLADQVPTKRFYNNSRVTTVVQGQTKHSVFQHGEQILAQLHVQSLTSETTLLATDYQRSVLHTAVSGEPQPMAYSPYGHRAENGRSSLLGFNGEQVDRFTGHYLLGNGYRAFNPVLMRFNSPDSLSPFGKGGLNAYTYALGNPVDRVDPTGHFSLKVAGMLLSSTVGIGGLAVAAVGVATGDKNLMIAGVGVGVLGTTLLFGNVFNAAQSARRARVSNVQWLSDSHTVGLGEQKRFLGRGKRLVIDGHGNGSTVGTYTPDELAAAVLNKYPDLGAKFTDIRLLACDGADGGANSYAQKLINLLNMPGMSYRGTVRAAGPLDILTDPAKFQWISIPKRIKREDGSFYIRRSQKFTPNIRNS